MDSKEVFLAGIFAGEQIYDLSVQGPNENNQMKQLFYHLKLINVSNRYSL